MIIKQNQIFLMDVSFWVFRYKMQAPQLTPQSSSEYSDGEISGDMAVAAIGGGAAIMAEVASTTQAVPLMNVGTRAILIMI
jgi:hypothetical protein